MTNDASRMTPMDGPTWSRLILWRPRAEFPLPPEWADRAVIPLGELRPLLQAVSPVRDLSDIWRWVAEPVPLVEMAAALASVATVTERPPGSGSDPGEQCLDLRVQDQCLQAALVLAPEGFFSCERVELTAVGTGWLETPAAEATGALLAVAAALRRGCACVAVGR